MARAVQTRAVALVVAFLVVAGCSGGGDGQANTEGAATSTSAPGSTAPDRPVEVSSLEALYDAPDPVPDVEHGTLLRYQVVEPSVADEGTTYRIMYASRSLAGAPIVVTGLAVVPAAAAPPGGRPVVSLGHGTTGIADVCAPSRSEPREAALGALTTPRNWILALTDYEGLGTPGRHPYLVGESQGRGVLDAALAVAQLPEADASAQVGLTGYSQGGQAVLFARQIADEWAPDLEVVGTMAGAPVSGLAESVDRFFDGPEAGFAFMLLAGFEAAFPDRADVTEVLTPAGVEWLDVVDDGCKDEVFAAVAAQSVDDLLLPTRLNVGSWPDLLEESDPGQVGADTPVLVLQSRIDEVIPLEGTRTLTERMCAHGDELALEYLDPSPHLEAGTPAFVRSLDWLADRFDGRPVESTCDAG